MDKVVEKAYEEICQSEVFFNSKGKGHPRLLVMSGLPMSGKSYLSNMISEYMDGHVLIIRTDRIRPFIAKHMGRKEPEYDSMEHGLVFELGHHLIIKALDNGWSVIADATNLTEQYRRWAVDAAKGRADQVLVAFIEISHKTAMERNVEKNRDGSAATPAVYALLNFDKEPIEKCRMPFIVINTETDVRPWVGLLAKWLSFDIEKVTGTVIPRTLQ